MENKKGNKSIQKITKEKLNLKTNASKIKYSHQDALRTQKKIKVKKSYS